MGIVIGLVLGIIIGLAVKTVVDWSSSAGSVYIYKGEPDENPYMFLAVSGGIEKFFKKRYIVLKIELKDKPPQD